MKVYSKLFSVLFWLMVPSFLKADLVLHFGRGGTANGISTSFAVDAGSNVTLDVWLSQTGTFQPVAGFAFGDYRLSSNPDTAVFTDGLGSFVFDVGTSTNQVSIGSATLGQGFLADPALTQPGGNTLRVGGFATNDLNGSTITPVFVPETYASQFGIANTGVRENNSIRLGSVTIVVPAGATGNVALTVSSPYDADSSKPENLLFFGLGNNLTQPLVGLVTTGNATMNITAVPEPSAMILVGLAAGSMGIATWRKRRLLANRISA